MLDGWVWGRKYCREDEAIREEDEKKKEEERIAGKAYFLYGKVVVIFLYTYSVRLMRSTLLQL